MAAIFLDRDGVINVFPGKGRYVLSWSAFRFLPGALEALAKLTLTQHRLFIVSNQSAVGRGILSSHRLQMMTQQMLRVIEAHGGRIERVLYCLHRPNQNCMCRKPNIGLLASALREDPTLTHEPLVMIGDSLTDILTGRAAGCQTILVLNGETDVAEVSRWSVQPDLIVDNLLACVEPIQRLIREPVIQHGS